MPTTYNLCLRVEKHWCSKKKRDWKSIRPMVADERETKFASRFRFKKIQYISIYIQLYVQQFVTIVIYVQVNYETDILP